MKAEIGVMLLQAKEPIDLPEAMRKARSGSPSQPQKDPTLLALALQTSAP